MSPDGTSPATLSENVVTAKPSRSNEGFCVSPHLAKPTRAQVSPVPLAALVIGVANFSRIQWRRERNFGEAGLGSAMQLGFDGSEGRRISHFSEINCALLHESLLYVSISSWMHGYLIEWM